MGIRAGILGASGYAGAELLRLCAAHPEIDVVVVAADGQVGERVDTLYPSLATAYPGLTFVAVPDADQLAGLDLLFCAMPQGRSQELLPGLVGHIGVIVDLGADFRLRDADLYPQWYGETHHAPELLGRFGYGLPELFRSELLGVTLVAAPGCYPTAAALALAPLVRSGVVDAGNVVVDAASGTSGAGRGLTLSTRHATADGDFSAYGLLSHRHTPEIEQATGASVIFTPHLAPMTRGILATCYARPASGGGADGATTADAIGVLEQAYDGEPFVTVLGADGPMPATKPVLGSNSAHVTARVDPRTGWVLAFGAIDNLGKGAAGQAVQCANLALGLDERTGLSAIGVYP